MIVSIFTRCSGKTFELMLLTLIDESGKLALFLCANCGAPAGAFDPTIGLKIEALKSQVTGIDERLS